MPERRKSAAIIETSHGILVLGGSLSDGSQGNFASYALVFDMRTNEWLYEKDHGIPNMISHHTWNGGRTKGRNELSLVKLPDNRVVALGGTYVDDMDGMFGLMLGYSNEVCVLDVASKSWSFLPSFPSEEGNVGEACAIALSDGNFAVLTCYGFNCFDFNTMEWLPLPMPPKIDDLFVFHNPALIRIHPHLIVAVNTWKRICMYDEIHKQWYNIPTRNNIRPILDSPMGFLVKTETGTEVEVYLDSRCATGG